MSESIDTIIPPTDEPLTEIPGAAPEVVETPEAPKPAHEPWYEQRIRAQAAKLAHEQTKREAAERELQSLRSSTQQSPTTQVTPQQQAAGLTQADVEARAAELTTQRADAQSFNAACNTTFEAGKAAHPDFAEKLRGFEHLGGLGSNIEFVKDVVSLPNGASVLYELAGDLDHAAHVLSLPARQQAMALATISTRLAASPAPATPVTPPVAVSKAPPPPKPLAGRSTTAGGNIYDPNISMGEYIRLRGIKN
jgi:hypothetical protein